MRLLQQALSETAQLFASHKMLHSQRQAEELFCELLNCTRLDLYQKKKRLLSVDEEAKCHFWVHRRLQGEPLAYLSGQVQFYGCFLEVNSCVLIPRPETEILVDKIVQILKAEDLQGKILWDICCGSGCIGIALKKTFPLLTVYLSDISTEALRIAACNARANQVAVTLLEGDLLVPFQNQRAHYVVCNPPYISEDEYIALDKEVKDYEPRQALLAGEKGLEFYERLASDLLSHLYPQAQVWLEIGYQQGEAIQKIFEAFGKQQRFENDWAGHNRFFFLENE